MASEGFSRINPLTKKPEYILPSGLIVPKKNFLQKKNDIFYVFRKGRVIFIGVIR